MGVWLATHCVLVSGTAAANSHSLDRTGRQQRRVRSQCEERRHTHPRRGVKVMGWVEEKTEGGKKGEVDEDKRGLLYVAHQRV